MPARLRNAAELIHALRGGAAVEFLFFWGHQPRADGTVGKSCLSQWWPAAFTVDGRRFATVEHYMMWHKATLFGDHDIADQVVAAPKPQAAKALGREVGAFDDEVWEKHRYDIVVAGNLAKFGRHDDLRVFLLGTGERVLVEASPVDRIWGIGLARDDPRASDPARWRGANLLGFALMDVRATLAGSPHG